MFNRRTIMSLMLVLASALVATTAWATSAPAAPAPAAGPAKVMFRKI